MSKVFPLFLLCFLLLLLEMFGAKVDVVVDRGNMKKNKLVVEKN